MFFQQLKKNLISSEWPPPRKQRQRVQLQALPRCRQGLTKRRLEWRPRQRKRWPPGPLLKRQGLQPAHAPAHCRRKAPRYGRHRNKPEPGYRRKTLSPARPSCARESWHCRWHRTGCPSFRCRKQHPCQHPFRAAQGSGRSSQVPRESAPRATGSRSYSFNYSKIRNAPASGNVRLTRWPRQ